MIRFLISFVAILFLGYVSPAFSVETTTNSTTVDQVDEPDFTNMKKGVIEQQKANQDLQRLKTEVEKVKTEVEKQKALRELAQLTGTDVIGAGPGGSGTTGGLIVKSIFCSERTKEAVVDAGGKEIVLNEGSAFRDFIVKQVTPESVVLVKDGKEETFNLRK